MLLLCVVVIVCVCVGGEDWQEQVENSSLDNFSAFHIRDEEVSSLRDATNFCPCTNH